MAFSFKFVRDWAFPAGLIVGIVSMVLSWVWKLIPGTQVMFATVDLRGQIISGMGTSVGDKVASFFGGITFPSPALVIITAIAITVVGALVLENLKFLPVPFRSVTGQFAAVILYGSIITMAILSMGFGFLMSITFDIVLVLYSLLVGWVTAQIFENFLKRQVPQLPR